MINEKAIKAYLRKKFRNVSQIKIRKLGSGVQGAGFLAEIKTKKGLKSYVIKSLSPKEFGHDYPSDRAAVFLLDLDEYKNLAKHVKAFDVLAEMENGLIKSIGGGKEYYLLLEKAEGRHYFNDLSGFAYKKRLEGSDMEKIKAMASYLAKIHSVKKDSKTLYWRKLRDTVGHGECLMGVFDIYPDGVLPYKEMTDIIKKSVDWIYKLKPKYKRLSQIHGDFHPGNILFKEAGSQSERPSVGESYRPETRIGKSVGATLSRRVVSTGDPYREVRSKNINSGLQSEADFILLDRSRGPWGEPADDVTALTINYVFFSIKNHGTVTGAYLEALKLFFDEYVRLSGDREIYKTLAPFFAFRGAVVANPVFYPEVTPEQRRLIFRFVNNVLDSERFVPEKIADLTC